MKAQLVRIGNSRGIRIPRPLIEECGFKENVELHVEKDRLVISPERRPRHDWNEAFRAAGSADQDEILLDSVMNRFDGEEWQW